MEVRELPTNDLSWPSRVQTAVHLRLASSVAVKLSVAAFHCLPRGRLALAQRIQHSHSKRTIHRSLYDTNVRLAARISETVLSLSEKHLETFKAVEGDDTSPLSGPARRPLSAADLVEERRNHPSGVLSLDAARIEELPESP